MSRKRQGIVLSAAVALIVAVATAVFQLRPPFGGSVPRRNSGSAATVKLSARKFTDLPGWRTSDATAALAAFRRSCGHLISLAEPTPMGGAGYAGAAGDWKLVCARLPREPAQLGAAQAFFVSNFLPFEVTGPGNTLFTGYYEPLVKASRTRHDSFQVPIYGPPDNLVSVDLGLFRAGRAGEHIEGCVANRHLLPCPPRAEIDMHPPAYMHTLLYADDPASLFFLHIQGSGRAQLDDGSVIRLVYAGQNGRPYTAIGRVLVQRRLLDRADLSMQSIRAWLQHHSQEARQIMETDQSYVFFAEAAVGNSGLGGIGSEGIPLTPRASVAVDPRIHPLGIPLYLVGARPAASSAGQVPMANLFVAQDTGGAIRGAARVDVFWGFGKEAEAVAGRMKSSGRMFVFLPKPVAARLPKTLLDVS